MVGAELVLGHEEAPALTPLLSPPPERGRKSTKGQKRPLLLKKPLRVDLVLENTSKIPAPKE